MEAEAEAANFRNLEAEAEAEALHVEADMETVIKLTASTSLIVPHTGWAGDSTVRYWHKAFRLKLA